MVAGIGGDALHVDTGLRIFLRTGAKPLNFFGYAQPRARPADGRGDHQPTDDETNQVYLASPSSS